jgi:hypothetical protein
VFGDAAVTDVEESEHNSPTVNSKEKLMGIGISILIGAAGAIMRYAITQPVNGIDLHTSGVILMFVGALGLLISVLFWSSFAPFGSSRRSSSRRVETVSRDGVERDRVVSETREV